MPHFKSNNRNLAVAALGIMLLGCLGLSACGGSSKGSSQSTSAAASTSTTGEAPGGGPGGANRGRFTALRECLQKNGIALPNRTPGAQRPPGGGGFLGGGAGLQLPKGVTRAQYEAILKKCGGGNFPAGGFNSPARTQALNKFAACMRQNGVNLPTPDTSGKGPIFNTKGLNANSAQFKAAQAKCQSNLVGAGPGGAGGGGAPTGAPPSGGPGAGGEPPAGAGGTPGAEGGGAPPSA